MTDGMDALDPLSMLLDAAFDVLISIARTAKPVAMLEAAE